MVYASTALKQPRFGQIIRDARQRSGLSVRAAARESSIDKMIWIRAEQGYDLHLSSAHELLSWLEIYGALV